MESASYENDRAYIVSFLKEEFRICCRKDLILRAMIKEWISLKPLWKTEARREAKIVVINILRHLVTINAKVVYVDFMKFDFIFFSCALHCRLQILAVVSRAIGHWVLVVEVLL